MFGSKLHQPKTAISQEEVTTAQKKLKAIKYPVRALSNAVIIKKKIDHFSQTIRKQLRSKLDRKINAYRQVRGDGNCFFRAFAFSMISSLKEIQFRSVFPYIDKVSLQSCRKESIPSQFREFYKNELLKQVFKKFWEKQIGFFTKITQDKYHSRNFKRALARMLTENPYMDFLIILYFRAVCLLALKQKRQIVKQFLKGTEEQQIRTYGQESQGVVLNLMSKFFDVNIYIYEVRKQEVINYSYKEKTSTISVFSSSNSIYLLFYDNHYDLIENNQDPLAEYEDQKMEEEYYQASSNTYVQGVCFECNKETQVNEENGLCLGCFNKSMENLNSFQKDRMVEGICNQCRKSRKKVSQQMQICESCLQEIQYASTSRVGRQADRQGRGYDDLRQRQRQHYCKKCQNYKTSQEMAYLDQCYSCYIKKRQNDFSESQRTSHNVGLSIKQTSPASSIYTTLDNKLESKIGQQQKDNLLKAKISQRSSPIINQCRRCQQTFESYYELPEKQLYCNSCNLIAGSSVKSSVAKSGVRKYNCRLCNNDFTSQALEELKPQQRKCMKCLNKFPTTSLVSKSELKTTSKCKKCGLLQDQFYKFKNGTCNPCMKNGTSTFHK